MNQHVQTPSPWVVRWCRALTPTASILDLACGRGRHAQYFSTQGHRVLAVDQDVTALDALNALEGVETLRADIENEPWPLNGRQFDAVVVCNYLHRPLWPQLLAAVAPQGLLIYETFMQGNARYGKPSNPDFLLRPGELLAVVSGMEVVAFEQGVLDHRAVVQRICARKGAAAEWSL